MTTNGNWYEEIEKNHQAEVALSERTEERRSDNYYYNNNIIHTEPGVLSKNLPTFDRKWLPEDGERILNAYLDNVADHMTAAAAAVIENAYKAGLEVDEIIMAIEETGLAERPTPFYLRAVLKNWIAEGYCKSRLRNIQEKNNSRVAWWNPDGKRR